MGRATVLVEKWKRAKRLWWLEKRWAREKWTAGLTQEKKKGAGWAGLEIWPMADIEFFTFQIFYRLQTHLSSNQI
jgi:hypothetical protein